MRYLTAVLFLMIGTAVVVADDNKEAKQPVPGRDEKPVSFWMEKKLEYSQEILRGLATGDLDLVAAKGNQMRTLSRVEGWVRNRKPGYKAQFQAFEFANTELIRHAKANRLDGSTIAFQQLTISCVSCHKMLRDID